MFDQINDRWEEILQYMKNEYEIGDTSFNTWFRPLVLLKFENNTAVIGGPLNKYFIDYLKTRYLLPLKISISEVTGIQCEISLVSDDEESEESRILEASERAGLNPRYTFDSFVVGSNNKFAHAAALAVAESPGQIYNPLFLYGGVGLGKTHLMHSIAYFIIEHNPDMKVLYVTSETFTNEVIAAIRSGNNSILTQFRDKYRNIDVLLLDDVQFIIGKDSTQEEFFHTFNTLHASGKQIILSSDRPPKDFDILEDRIRSRFEWGLMADIQKPDFETRMAILQKKQELDGREISDDVLQFIASNVKSNIRELELSLNMIYARERLENKSADISLAERALHDVISTDKKKVVTPQFITDIVADHFNLTIEEIKTDTRAKKISFPRQIAMYLIRKILNLNYSEIGDIFGGKNHTTVMHAVEKIEKDIDQNAELDETIRMLIKKINPA